MRIPGTQITIAPTVPAAVKLGIMSGPLADLETNVLRHVEAVLNKYFEAEIARAGVDLQTAERLEDLLIRIKTGGSVSLKSKLKLKIGELRRTTAGQWTVEGILTDRALELNPGDVIEIELGKRWVRTGVYARDVISHGSSTAPLELGIHFFDGARVRFPQIQPEVAK